MTIEDAFDEGLPRAYTPELYKTNCAVLFEHVFETLGEAARKWLTGQPSSVGRKISDSQHQDEQIDVPAMACRMDASSNV